MSPRGSISLPAVVSCRDCREWNHASCARRALPPPSSPSTTFALRATALNLFAYTFCKITLCGLHPESLPPPWPRGRPSALGFLLSLPAGKLPSNFRPRSLMYAKLHGRNSKFGTAVLGVFTMSFHPQLLFAARARARKGEDPRAPAPTRLAPTYEGRTRVILIRTRP